MFTTTLPGGYFHTDGSLHLDVQVSLLNGKDEEIISKQRTGDKNILISLLLAKSIQRLGSIDNVTEEITQELLVADRQFLLLKLREYTFGEIVQGTALCPEKGCHKKVDFEFSLADIPVKPLEDKKPYFTFTLPDSAIIRKNGDIYKSIVFRLPNGRDQQMLSPLLQKNDQKVEDLLLASCITRIGPIKKISEDFISSLSDETKKIIRKEMWRKAPSIETSFEAHCPECGSLFDFPFDVTTFFFNELTTSLDLLYREVHYLSFYYHWSEEEIMSMPRDKRRHYIRILSEEIERLNDEE